MAIGLATRRVESFIGGHNLHHRARATLDLIDAALGSAAFCAFWPRDVERLLLNIRQRIMVEGDGALPLQGAELVNLAEAIVAAPDVIEPEPFDRLRDIHRALAVHAPLSLSQSCEPLLGSAAIRAATVLHSWLMHREIAQVIHALSPALAEMADAYSFDRASFVQLHGDQLREAASSDEYRVSVLDAGMVAMPLYCGRRYRVMTRQGRHALWMGPVRFSDSPDGTYELSCVFGMVDGRVQVVAFD